MAIRTEMTLLLAIAVSAGLYFGFELDDSLRLGLAILGGIAVLWVTETFHITITALLIPVLAVISGIFSVSDALRHFANPIIFLFLGGFSLAAALRAQQLDVRIANGVIHLSQGNMKLAIVMIFAATSFVSMWISNTATAAMMLPLALGLLQNYPYEENRRTYWFVLLGIAYSANIGGIGTLVGSPPNAIAAAAVGISFAQWLSFGLPTVIAMFPLILALLWLIFRPQLGEHFQPKKDLQPMQRKQWLTLSVFLLTVTLWLFSKPIAEQLEIQKGFDCIVAIIAIVLLAALRLVEWKEIEHSADWGVLLLFGGGLTLSALLKTTGTSVFLASAISGLLQEAPLILFLLAVAFFVVMLTEVASNTASSALLVPIFVSIAGAMGLSPVVLAALIAVAASCAFMLPVATPPNAIVFGTGYVPQRQMMRTGIVLNLIISILIATGAWLIL